MMRSYDEIAGRCARCRARIRVRVVTDGDGRLAEVPDPCPRCGPGARRPIAEKKKLWGPADRAATRAALLRGYPTTAVAKELGVPVAEVRKMRETLKARGLMPVLCRCGAPAGHKGRCRSRWDK